MALQIVHSPDTNALARELGHQIKRDIQEGRIGFFEPVSVVVPNASMAMWLKLRLADDLGIAAGFEFPLLEHSLRRLLGESDARGNSSRKSSRLTSSHMQRLVLSLLTASELDDAPEMEPVWNYIGKAATSEWEADGQRRAWQLSDKVGRLFPEYELQRATMIAVWQEGRCLDDAALDSATQRWQQRIYYELFKPNGWRDNTLPNRFTLPQLRARQSLDGATPQNAPIYWFGIGHTSPFYLELLCDLGKSRDFRFFLPLSRRNSSTPDHELLQLWGVSSRQSQAMVEEREKQAKLEMRACPPADDAVFGNDVQSRGGVLQELRAAIIDGRESEKQAQDGTLQVWACPGRHREVETVFNLILQRLEQDSTLRLSDVAIVVSDVNEYLPHIQEVFSRHDGAISYNLVDANAAQTSVFSTAVTSLLGLVGSAWTRREVFVLLNNPCFLARVGADLEMPRQWLAWTDHLGIFHSYDRAMKSGSCDDNILATDARDAATDARNAATDARDAATDAREDAATDIWGDAHTWLAGLRRLRLGRIMAASADLPPDEREYSWQNHIPYVDLETSGATLDRFSLALELLFRQCANLGDKSQIRAPSQWAVLLRAMIDACLETPLEAPAEASVRFGVYDALHVLASLDKCFPRGVSLDFARSHLLSHLEDIPASYGRPLLTITIASPRQLRLLPFRDVYFVGLGEGQFPGEADRSTLDLRQGTTGEGDLSVPDINRQMFLDAFLAARDRLVLTYSNRDLEKDAELGPCSVISQLESHLEQQVFSDGALFEEASAPLHGRSAKYLHRAEHDSPYSPLINYDNHDHTLALAAAKKGLPETFKVKFDGGAHTKPASEPSPLSCRDLKDFLVHPAQALLKRRLRLADDAIDGTVEVENEPFITEFPNNLRLASAIQEIYVRHVVQGGARNVDLPTLFNRFYDDAHKRSLTPDGVFKDLDKDARQQAFIECIKGERGLDNLLQSLRASACWSVGIGDSRRGQSTVVFPDLCVEAGAASVSLRGGQPFVWQQPDAIHCLVLTDSRQPENLNPDKNGRWRLVKHILEPLLFFVALQAGSEIGPDGISSRDWVGGRRLVLDVSSPTGVHSASFDVPADEAADYLRRLSQSYRTMAAFEELPLSILMDEKKLWPLTPENDNADYARRLESAVEEKLADKHNRDSSRMELLSLIDELRVPGDARQKIEERLMPLHRWRV